MVDHFKSHNNSKLRNCAAYHEAGHAVAKLLVRTSTHRIYLRPRDGRQDVHHAYPPNEIVDIPGWHPRNKQIKHEIRVALAGFLAEVKANPENKATARCFADIDFGDAQTLINEMGGSNLNVWTQRVKKWVESPNIWAAIDRFARDLMAHGSIPCELIQHLYKVSQGSKKAERQWNEVIKHYPDSGRHSKIPNLKIEEDFEQWLKSKDQQRAEKWKRERKKSREGAACEAYVWRLITENGISENEIIPNPASGPDFLINPTSHKFHVEATCITAGQACYKMYPEDESADPGAAVSFRTLAQPAFNETKNKVKQCSGQNVPVLLAIGTFHWETVLVNVLPQRMTELLIGQTCMASWNTPSGQRIFKPHTSLKNALFLSAREGAINPTGRPISAVLICGFAVQNPQVYGILHPEPNHRFDTKLLPNISFCALKKGWRDGNFEVEWIRNGQSGLPAPNNVNS